MRTSPARAHLDRHVAASRKAAADGAAPDRAMATAYELMLGQLAEHRRRLKDVQSIERKADVKRQFLPMYASYVEGALDADHGGQDDVLMTIMVWRMDVGDYGGALPIARYAIEHKLVMPDQYQRSTATIIAEELAEAALAAIGAKQGFAAQVLIDAEQLTRREDMPDEVRAKLHKAIGYAISTDESADLAALDGAAENWARAMALHPKVGVKKDLERLGRRIKALHADTPEASPPAQPNTADAAPPGDAG